MSTMKMSTTQTSTTTTNTTKTLALWVAEGPNGVVGSIRHDANGYVVTMAGSDAVTGTYPDLAVAKGALHSHMAPGSDWPTYREH